MLRIVLAILILTALVLAPGCHVGGGVGHHGHHCATPEDALVFVDGEKLA